MRVLALMSAAFSPLLLVLQIAWFLAPGLGISVWLCSKSYISKLYVLPIAALCSCLFGYIAFWIFLASHTSGEVYSWGIAGAGILSLASLLYNKNYRKLLTTFEILMPLALWCIVTLLYTSLAFGCYTTPTAVSTDQSCYFDKTPFDNVLPKLFADNVYNGHPKTLLGDWQGSDRPPLQSGIVLAEAPLTESLATHGVSYQLLATFLQLLWVPIVWMFGRRLNLTGKQLAVVLLVCLSSGFFFFNSVFTWPKLLAGSLGAIGLSLLLFERATVLRWLLGGMAIGSALLAHGGVAFTLLPIAFLLLTKRFFPGWKIILAGIVAMLLLLVPWVAYQHFYDPPGNRLLKWEIGGVIQIDNRSFGTALRQSYTQAGLRGTAHNKLSNAYTLFYAPDGMNHLYGQGTLGTLRDIEFRFVFFGLGLLNLGWPLLIVPSWHRRLKKSGINIPRLKLMLEIAAGSLVVWVITMFGPGTTIIHQGSYLTMLLLFMGLGAVITVFPRYLLRAIISLKIIYFVLVWIIAVYLHHFISDAYVMLSLLGAATLTYLLITLYNHALPSNK